MKLYFHGKFNTIIRIFNTILNLTLINSKILLTRDESGFPNQSNSFTINTRMKEHW